jgi:SAM-dependent methyltransferase
MKREDLEKSAREAYGRIAQSYYTAINPTTRLFDLAIARYLDSHPPLLNREGYYVEVGSGRTRLGKFLASPAYSLVLVDVCKDMIVHSMSSNGVNQRAEFLIASAFWLPFESSTYSGVYSFLGDAFNTSDYFEEVLRVLVKGGEFIHVVPKFDWAKVLRKEIGISLHQTCFPQDGDGKVFAPSVVWPNHELKTMLVEKGFVRCITQDLCVPREVPKDQLSSHITIPSRKLHRDPYELPFLTVLRAQKP